MCKITIAPAFRGKMVPSDLLSTEGTLMKVVETEALKRSGTLFTIIEDDFVFALNVQSGSIVLQRNKVRTAVDALKLPAKADKAILTVKWSSSKISLRIIAGGVEVEDSSAVRPAVPPATLIKWARMQNLLPVTDYDSEEEFRQRVYSSLASVQARVTELGAVNPFWDVEYEGGAIKNRKPKREPDIHPTIHSLLFDQMLSASIEVVPEYHTGVGNLDFMFIGSVRDRGLCRLCAEFKPAHSQDVVHGLTTQLPLYMRNKSARYGAYCVLNFKSSWFDEPKASESELLLKLVTTTTVDGIRIFMFDLTKPTSASKAH